MGDTRTRYVCDGCGIVHYQNPKVVTGCIPEWDGKVLLCRRAIAPRKNYWTLPAGFMENGESIQEGAARETLEEANAEVEVNGLYTLFNLPAIDQIYTIFRGRLLNLDFGPGDESLEVALFSYEQIPWNELAFHVVTETLKFYFQDQQQDSFVFRSGTIHRLPGEIRRYRTIMLP